MECNWANLRENGEWKGYDRGEDELKPMSFPTLNEADQNLINEARSIATRLNDGHFDAMDDGLASRIKLAPCGEVPSESDISKKAMKSEKEFEQRCYNLAAELSLRANLYQRWALMAQKKSERPPST